MKKLFALTFLLASVIAFAQSADSVIPQKGTTTDNFVPQGWKIISSVSGDLNNDKTEDVVIVIENTDPDNFIENEKDARQILNLNPRYFLILFKVKNGYTLNKTFIPSQNDIEFPCLEDPIAEADEMTIVKGVLSVNFRTWMICGSYGICRETFKFRYQDSQFVLIGYDLWESSRNIGNIKETSINFLSGKKSITTGDNLFEDIDKAVTQTIWEDIEINELINLANLKWPNEIEF